MKKYAFYFWSLIPTTPDWQCYIYQADNIEDAYGDADRWAEDNCTYAVAAELHSTSLVYTPVGVQKRVQELHKIGIPFPDNFDPQIEDLRDFTFPDGTLSCLGKLPYLIRRPEAASKAIILKANILPVEVHNLAKVDPNLCMDVTRLLCKGAAGSRSL